MNRVNVALYGILLLLATLIIFPVMQFAGAEEITEPTESSAECMAVIECSSKRLLYAKNEDNRRPMASTTKICTAITVLENCGDYNKTVTVPRCAEGVEGSSVYLKAGENIKVIDLLYGLMLRSGNDCAVALAVTIGGSAENFCSLMNKTAAKAGASNTYFTNPHGLHDDNHYTTALDLALITAYAFKNDTFAKIVAAKNYTVYNENGEKTRVFTNKNKLLSSYDGADGVKTGYTKKAGRCLVASATRGGMRVIAVVLNCGPMFEECCSLMDKAFSNYALYDIFSGERYNPDSVIPCKKQEYYFPLTLIEAQKLLSGKDYEIDKGFFVPVPAD